MPAGVGWFQYSMFFAAAMASMLAGSQFVHVMYKPLENMETLVNIEIKRLEAELARKKPEKVEDEAVNK